MIVGVSPAIRRALGLVQRYASTRLTVLLVGPTGTGKDLFARHVHDLSGRRGPIVDVNCCALPRDMVEGLLFGHKRGAFTGAVDSAVGHVERSHDGTLFLDELGSLATESQGKLLRVLESGEVQPLGASAKRRVDFRVVSAVGDDIGMAIEAGRFRRDLFQRVAGVVIELPALERRPEDIVPLAEHFAAMSDRRLEPGVEGVLLNYSWPGNVRELGMAIERAGELVDNGTLSPGAVAEAIELGGVPNRGPANSNERASLVEICQAHGWHGGRICRALGISRTTLHTRLVRAGLSLRQGKREHGVRHCAEHSRTTERPNAPTPT